ncbi:MAG: S9 family peptidase, partial [Salinibacter sp.]
MSRLGVLRFPLAALFALLFTASVGPATAQPSDATLDEVDYGQWERLGGATLSPEGTWMATPIRRVNGNHELRIHHTRRDTTRTVAFGRSPAFSADGQWLAYAIGMSEEKRKTLRKQEKPVRRKMGLLNLATGDTTVVPAVSDFAFSDGGRYLAMRRYPPQETPDDMRGADLLVRDLQAESYTSFGNVADMAWQHEAPHLALTIDGMTETGNGVRLYDAATGQLQTLASTPGDYTGLSWRPAEDDLAALRTREDDDWQHKTHVVLAWTGLNDGAPERHQFDPATAEVFPDSLRIVDYRTPEWATERERLFFGVQEREAVKPDSAQADSAAADSLEEYGPAGVKVWHTSDVDIIPRQEVQSEQDRQDNYLTAWHLGRSGDARWTRLGTELTEDVQVLHGGTRAVGLDQTPYREERMFGPVYHDLYAIDVATGERERVAEKIQFFEGPSPNGRYLLWLKNDQYHAYNLQEETATTITEDVPVPVVDVDDDHTVEQKPPFGIAGWTTGDQSVLVYGEYDVWRIAPDGSTTERLTTGRADSVRHRYVDLTDEAPGEPDVIPRNAP